MSCELSDKEGVKYLLHQIGSFRRWQGQIE